MVRTLRGTRSVWSHSDGITGLVHDLEYESSLEQDLISLRMFDEDVTELQAQPLKIQYVHPTTGRSATYTPDLRVQRGPAKTELCEVKPRKILDKDPAHWEVKFAAARAFCGGREGWFFEVYDESRIRTTRLSNVQFLWQHRFVEYESYAELSEHIVEILRARSMPVIMDEVLQPLFPDFQTRGHYIWAWWCMVANRVLRCDLDEPLGPMTFFELNETERAP